MILEKSARQAMKTRGQSKKLMNFSKAWVVNDKLSVFFPIFWTPELDEDGNVVMTQEVDQFGKKVTDASGQPVMTEKGVWDIVTASVWGHDVGDMKAFPVGGTFIPSLTDVVRGQPVKILRDEKGRPLYDDNGEVLTEPVAGDVTYQFSRIAPLFIKGAKQKEIDETERKNFTSDGFRRQALNDIDDKYDTDKNINAPRPVVGKLHMFVSTEVFVVKHDSVDNYDVDNASMYTYKLSDEKISQILSLLDDYKYRPRDLHARWFEVQMTFSGDSNDMKGRGQAARKAVPTGLSPEYQMSSRSPESYAKIVGRLSGLPEDSVTITCRNFAYTKIVEAKIKRCIDSYVIMHSDLLDHISAEDDMEQLLGSAARLMQFNVLNNMENADIKDQINNAYTAWLDKHPEEKSNNQLVSETAGYQEPKFDTAPTMRDLISGEAGVSLPGEDDANVNGDMLV